MKKQYIKPVSAISAMGMQPILAASGDGQSAWETEGDTKKNPDTGDIEAGGDASEFEGGTGAKHHHYNVWEAWDD